MPEPSFLALVAVVFLLAGSVKGVVGLGFPAVTLALLTLTIGLEPALAMVPVPALITNIRQALTGGAFGEIARRLRWFLLAGVAGTLTGVALQPVLGTRGLSVALAAVLIGYALSGLIGWRLRPPGRREPVQAPLMGGLSGLATGLTAAGVLPAAAYFQSLGYQRDRLIQALGIWFCLASLTLGIALWGVGRAPPALLLASLLCTGAALIGMRLGEGLRRGLSDARLQRTFFLAILLMGLWILLRTLVLSA